MANPADLALNEALGAAAASDRTGQVDAEERKILFTRLAREHAPTVLSLARRLAPTAEDAEDLVQETWLKAWRGLGRFRREADPKTWVFRILVNASHDRIRRRRRTAKAPPAGRSAGGPERSLLERDLLARVLGAVHALPRRQRECLLLKVRAGLTYREIAEVLDISTGMVKLHLVEARRRLSRRFEQEVGTERP